MAFSQSPAKPAAPTAKTSSTAATRPATKSGAAQTPAAKKPASEMPVLRAVVKPLFTERYADIKIGTGAPAEPGKFYHVLYAGYLATTGQKFDSSQDHPAPVMKDGKPVIGEDGRPVMGPPEPLVFPQGMGRLITGFDQGLAGMRVGGKRRVFIPWQLAYGIREIPAREGHIGIPPKSDLIFDIELVEVSDMPTQQVAPRPVPPPTPQPTPPPVGSAPPTPPPAASAPQMHAPGVEEAALSLAPSGRLRVAINLGNSVLAQRTPGGALTGASVILAQILAKRLNVPLDLIPYTAAGMVFDALGQNAWDIAFLAIEPERATRVDFSPPYVFIDGTYLVRKDSPFQKTADLDRTGVRIAVARGAAYDLYLSRTLKNAELLRSPNSPAAMQMFVDEHLDAAAGVRQALADYAHDKPALKVMEDSFSRIDQAIGVPRGRSAGAAYIRAFIEEMKSSGQVRRALDETGQTDANVAPPAPGQN